MKFFWKFAMAVVCGALIVGVAALAWREHRANVSAAAKLVDEIQADRASANEGNAVAEANLGYWYYYGRGVPQDYAEALRWFRQSADQGYARAQMGMGYIYYYGHGVAQDYVVAMAWFRSAADQGSPWAQGQLGAMYSHGQGAPQNIAEATRWYRKAADQGDTMAETNLGYAYSHAKGVPQDYAEATRWYRKAADQGDPQAEYDLGALHYFGRGMPQNRAEAYRWFNKAAAQGNGPAIRALGVHLTPLRRFNLVAELLVGLWFSLSFFWHKIPLLANVWPNSHELATALIGMLWIAYAGLSWYGYSHHLVRQLTVYPNTFTWARLALQVIAIALTYALFEINKKRNRVMKNEDQSGGEWERSGHV